MKDKRKQIVKQRRTEIVRVTRIVCQVMEKNTIRQSKEYTQGESELKSKETQKRVKQVGTQTYKRRRHKKLDLNYEGKKKQTK